MTVSELLSTLVSKDVDVALIDRDSEELLVQMKSGGYASLQDDIESRPVTKWKINNSSSIEVYLGATATDPATDPVTDPDPNDP